jgi:hypothetical protein
VFSPEPLGPGVHLVFPFTRVVKMSSQTRELQEVAEVPSKEGLVVSLEVSVLYRPDPEKTPAIDKSGRRRPCLRGRRAPDPIRDSRDHSRDEARALYSGERE